MCCHSIENNFDRSNNSSLLRGFSNEKFDEPILLPRDIFTTGTIAQVIPLDVVNATLEKHNIDKFKVSRHFFKISGYI
jgi:hypothetical protein